MLAERQLAGGRDLEPHLVLDVGHEHPVALTELAGGEVEEELRHVEQRQTLGARARALRPGQHQMEDVLEEVVGVRGGDEPLDALDVPGAVVLLDRLGPSRTDVGAGVGLGEHHGRSPATLAGDHGPVLLLLGAQAEQDLREARAAGIHPDRRVGAEHVLVQRPHHRGGHRHAAEILVQADLVPAALDERANRLLERLGQGHRVGVGVEDRRVAVALDERLRQRTLGEAGHLVEHLAAGVGIEIAEITRLERLVHAEHLEQVENLIANVALVVAHDSSLRTPPSVGYSPISYPPVTSTIYPFSARMQLTVTRSTRASGGAARAVGRAARTPPGQPGNVCLISAGAPRPTRCTGRSARPSPFALPTLAD